MPRQLLSSRFYHPKNIADDYRSLSSSLCSFLHSPVSSALLGPNVFIKTRYSNTLNPCSSLTFCDQVSHPYKTTGKIKRLLPTRYYNLLKSYLNECQFEKKFNTETSTRFLIHSGVPQGSILCPSLYKLYIYLTYQHPGERLQAHLRTTQQYLQPKQNLR